jgi:hypothetical protein
VPGGMVGVGVAPVVMSLGLGVVSWRMSVYGKQLGTTLCFTQLVRLQIWVKGAVTRGFFVV